jgi:DNA-binding SARP family transcriptional activator
VIHEEIEVAVLGPVVVRGAPQPFHRAAARDLVVYLAFHRSGAGHREWSLALWPDRAVSSATVHSTASDARRALGSSSDGSVRLPRGPSLHLHRSVTTDVDRFARLSRSDRHLEACRLLRGPLFGGLRLADWAVLDGTAAEVESLVVHEVLQGSARLLRNGDAAEAEWVVRRGLLISPYDERLYRALLRTVEAQGNRTRMRAAMAQLLVVAREAPAPFRERDAGGMDALHPDTTRLYRQLLWGRPAPGGVPATL